MKNILELNTLILWANILPVLTLLVTRMLSKLQPLMDLRPRMSRPGWTGKIHNQYFAILYIYKYYTGTRYINISYLPGMHVLTWPRWQSLQWKEFQSSRPKNEASKKLKSCTCIYGMGCRYIYIYIYSVFALTQGCGQSTGTS